MRMLKRLFRSAPRDAETFEAALAPEATLAVIGDIHGCDRLLEKLLAAVDAAGPDRIVFVGDIIDRGEHSAQVLGRLHDLSGGAGEAAVVLKGNHEDMMLDFLAAPAGSAARWLRFGGLQTLASFGIGGLGSEPDEAKLMSARDALADALGGQMLSWLETLPTSFVSGNVAVVHAGADPRRPIDDQSDRTLIWGHPAFARSPRRDGIWVAHGHTIVESVKAEAGRIAVDTGAYATGRLSAAVIGPDRFEVLTARY